MAPFCRSWFALILCIEPCCVAFADGMTVRVFNNGPDALQVTVWDLNAHPKQKVVDGQTISGFAATFIEITPAGGRGQVAWSASSIDADMPTCGHRTRSNLHAGSTINVSAGQACAAR